MKVIRVLVVDDSAFMRRVISDIINARSDMRVVGTARNGEDAIAKIPQLKPDVVTLDLEMPVMDGISTLQRIMEWKLPVIMLSSLTQAGADLTVRALQLGAVDFVPKPSGTISLDIANVADDIVSKIRIAARTQPQLKGTAISRPLPRVGLEKKTLRTTRGGPPVHQTGVNWYFYRGTAGIAKSAFQFARGSGGRDPGRAAHAVGVYPIFSGTTGQFLRPEGQGSRAWRTDLRRYGLYRPGRLPFTGDAQSGTAAGEPI